MRSRGFTLPETIFAAALLLLIVIFVLPILGKARTQSRRLQSSIHMRGIHSGMVLYGQGGKDFFPGLSSNGEADVRAIPPTATMHGTLSTSGFEPRYRMAILLRGNYFSPEYAISPCELDGEKLPSKFEQDVTTANFSFAMLRIDAAKAGTRHAAWRSSDSATQAILSDRNLGGGGADARSIHEPEGPWIGSVVYNDNHAEFHSSRVVKTAIIESVRYPLKGWIPLPRRVDFDDLFGDDVDDNGTHGNDAAMVYQDATTYVNQK